jgi:hypothetical protein
LEQLSNNDGFEEAMDTVVRERVWEELKYEWARVYGYAERWLSAG